MIIKDNLNAKSITSDNDVDESRLLSVLTHGSTGRNPTFFKAYGHNDVFGLRVDIPEGCTTLEIAENLPNEDPGGLDEPRQGETENQNVLYVQLPDGHPVITGTDQVSSQVSLASNTNISNSIISKMSSTTRASEQDSPNILSGKSAPVQPSLSFEEAVEQAELIFDDGQNVEDIAQISEESNSSNILTSSSSKSLITATATSTTPDLNVAPVLPTSYDATSMESSVLPQQQITFNTATRVNKLGENRVSGSDLVKVHMKDNSDTLKVANDIRNIEKSLQNKPGVTLVQIKQQGSSHRDDQNTSTLETGKPGVNLERKVKPSYIQSSSTNKVENNLNTAKPSSIVSQGALNGVGRETQSNLATEIISIKASEKDMRPTNLNQKLNTEASQRRTRNDHSMLEMESLSRSVMVMTNVEDEIEVDGSTNNSGCSAMNSSKATMSMDYSNKSLGDTIDGREKGPMINISERSKVETLSDQGKHHNLRPKRSLRHVHALKQQAKRRKRNTSLAAAAASGGATNNQSISNTPDSSTMSIQRATARRPSVGRDNGGKY